MGDERRRLRTPSEPCLPAAVDWGIEDIRAKLEAPSHAAAERRFEPRIDGFWSEKANEKIELSRLSCTRRSRRVVTKNCRKGLSISLAIPFGRIRALDRLVSFRRLETVMTFEEIAAALWDARLQGRTIELDDADRPATIEAAYRIQKHQCADAGMEQVGWKLGATNTKALEALGLESAFAGPLLAPFRRESGASIELPVAQSPVLEVEFSITLGRDIPAQSAPLSAPEIAPMVEHVAAALEVVGCRLPGGLSNGGKVLIADGAANIVWVEGERSAVDWRSLDLGQHECILTVNGQEKARSSGSMLMWGDALAAAGHLAAHPVVAERGLKAGDIILTGACSALPIAPGDRARADFGSLGSVEASFV
ncbi:MAG: fumarylacetoacetate hydrolase family protein [Ectothiorhodospiraceae bacterium AqS1]|nr:fumarylacetoacetate hydrolase family protein [Ectothiorhodospiraceae bacterium AqS1]MBF2761251.1 fumarylacetoacetate hydrolase family protein [Ectothiorhodospiraceae bacterium AqS1]MBF2761505.1 fumarylacetoacetate hydrolase family protein [Ectothiorhodospiraceae bacterium AqS1]